MASLLLQCLIWTSAARDLLSTANIDYYNSVVSYTDLPRAVDFAAVGCSKQNNKVLVFGGSGSTGSLITVDTDTYNMSDSGEYYLYSNGMPSGVDVYRSDPYISQFYTQVDVECPFYVIASCIQHTSTYTF